MATRAKLEASRDYLNRKPSSVTEIYYICVSRRKGKYPKPTSRSGKWLVFGEPDRIDKIWMAVRVATETGLLGGYSQVSTSREGPQTVDRNRRVIMVHTYDSDDLGDVTRIRTALRGLGATEKIPYKTDEKSRQGITLDKGYTPDEVWKYQA
jgi:hypothetical protein